MSDPMASAAPFSSLKKRLFLMAMCINFFVFSLIAAFIYQSRIRYEERAGIATQNIVNVLDRHIKGEITSIDIALLSVKHEAEEMLAQGGMQRAELDKYIFLQHSQLPLLQGIRVTNAKGDAIAGTGLTAGAPVYLGDRDYFIAQRDNPKGDLFISMPLLGRIAKTWVINMARRINRPDGSFAGTVHASVPIDHFVRIFSELNIGARGSITLRNSRLALLARYPEIPDTLGTTTVSEELREKVTAGLLSDTYKARAGIDKVVRRISFKTIPGCPLILIVGLAEEEYLADWRRESRLLLGLMIFFALITVVFSRMQYRWWLRERMIGTELHKAKAALDLAEQIRESEEKFRNLFNNSEVAMFRTWLDGSEILDANRKWLELVGKTREEAIGRPSEMFWADPKDREQMVRTLISEGRVSRHEMQVHNPLKGARDCILSVVLYPREGILEGTVLDITDSKRAETALREKENKYRSLFENANDGIFLLNETGFIDCNQRGADMYGSTRERIIGRSPREFAPERQPDGRRSADVEGAIIEAAMKGTPQFFEWQSQRADGRKIDVEITLSSLELDGTICLQAIVRDIGERKQFEHERLKTQKLESIGTLAGGIAHDFNNLLQVVFGYISLAKMKIDSRTASLALLDQAEEALHMSVQLTTQLLTFSKGGSPKRSLMRIETTLEKAVKFALSGSRTNYRLNIASDLLPVEADSGQIAQVMQNIVLNASEAMEGGGTVVIRAGNRDIPPATNPRIPDGGTFVAVEIEDNGSGIPPETIAKIYDPYFTTKEKGSGLGLATSYSIIKNHGGIIEAASEMNRGTVFTLYLPAGGDTVVEAAAAAAIPAAERMGRILLMDDEDIVRNVAKEMIAALGHEVQAAENGQRAIELYSRAKQEESPFDLIILDLTVKGGMGGEEALAKIRAIDPEVKAVVSSGYSDSPVVAQYLTYGFSAVLNKPYNIETVKGCLSRFFAQ